MSNPILLPEEEPTEFAGMTPEAVAAFVFKYGGEQALRQTFQMADEIEPQTCESLEQTAMALERRGLSAPATILREIASQTPGELDLCPYHEPGLNRDYWLQSRRLRQRRLRYKAGKKYH